MGYELKTIDSETISISDDGLTIKLNKNIRELDEDERARILMIFFVWINRREYEPPLAQEMAHWVRSEILNFCLPIKHFIKRIFA